MICQEETEPVLLEEIQEKAEAEVEEEWKEIGLDLALEEVAFARVAEQKQLIK